MTLPVSLQRTRAISRRHFFGRAGLGFGSIALSSLLTREAAAAEENWKIPAKAKSIIYLHMAGSPSQLELFDPSVRAFKAPSIYPVGLETRLHDEKMRLFKAHR